jgi:hypothetical protein
MVYHLDKARLDRQSIAYEYQLPVHHTDIFVVHLQGFYESDFYFPMNYTKKVVLIF